MPLCRSWLKHARPDRQKCKDLLSLFSGRLGKFVTIAVSVYMSNWESITVAVIISSSIRESIMNAVFISRSNEESMKIAVFICR